MISGMESIRDQCTGTSRVRTILHVRNNNDIQQMNSLVSCLSYQVFTYIITFHEGMLHYLTLFQNNWIQHITDTKTIRDTTLPAVETAKVSS